MAHIYDYQTDFKDLDVAFVAKYREPEPPTQKRRSTGVTHRPSRSRNEQTSYKAPGSEESCKRRSSADHVHHSRRRRRRGASLILNPFRRIGNLLAYPGSWKTIQKMVKDGLDDGRYKLATEHDAKRAKIETADGNYLDTMIVDQRWRGNENDKGNILMICCEGNSGFYEIGGMWTALQVGYSTIGWNPPGFLNSTGSPYPRQIQLAIDAVMQFAIDSLKFPENQIIVFGYSIGGYPATWAATQYPAIRGLILDATFDELFPVVLSHLRGKIRSIMQFIAHEGQNLNIAQMLEIFDGPVGFIRRSKDEIIGTNTENGYINHTNFLVKKFLARRYPEIVNEETFPVLDDYLNLYDATQDNLLNQFVVKCPACPNLLKTYLKDHANSRNKFPVEVGKSWDLNTREHVCLHLAEKHLTTCPGLHVDPLPVHLLKEPWNAFSNQ